MSSGLFDEVEEGSEGTIKKAVMGEGLKAREALKMSEGADVGDKAALAGPLDACDQERGARFASLNAFEEGLNAFTFSESAEEVLLNRGEVTDSGRRYVSAVAREVVNDNAVPESVADGKEVVRDHRVEVFINEDLVAVGVFNDFAGALDSRGVGRDERDIVIVGRGESIGDPNPKSDKGEARRREKPDLERELSDPNDVTRAGEDTEVGFKGAETEEVILNKLSEIAPDNALE